MLRAMGGTKDTQGMGAAFPAVDKHRDVKPARIPHVGVPWQTTLDLTEDEVAELRGTASGSDADDAINVQVANLRAYSTASAADARLDRALLWAFKVPVIVGSTAAATLAGLGDTTAAVILSSASAICAAIDALRPRGLLFGVHRRASNEAALAAANIQSEWQATKLEVTDDDERRLRAAELVRKCNDARQKIDEYVTAAEASVDGGRAHSG
jgi:hypothetical protein